jgi:hypothetical protein
MLADLEEALAQCDVPDGISIDQLIAAAASGQVRAIRGIPGDTVDRRFTRLAAAVDVYDADICDAMERQDWRLVREAMARKFVALASEHLYGLLVDASFEGLV